VTPFLAERIAGIGADRASGAAELALRAAEVLSSAEPEELSDAARAMILAQPAMAAVYNAAQAALAGTLPQFIDRLRTSADLIASKTTPHIHGKVVLTHSCSSTVVHALRAGRPRTVICTESLPGGEGRRTAAVLNGRVIHDAVVYSALSDIEVVVVGADAVTPETVINKVGTAMVALAARERRRPVWVLCGSEKFVPSGWKPELGELFESIPRAWVTRIIDDL
jgi:translation initiation factor eIF-2B subunit delta